MTKNNSNKPFFKEGGKESSSSRSTDKSSPKGRTFNSESSASKKNSFTKKENLSAKSSLGKKTDFKSTIRKNDNSAERSGFAKKSDFKTSFGDKKFGSKFKPDDENRFDKKTGSGGRGKYAKSSDRPKGVDYNPPKYEEKKNSNFSKKQFFTKRVDEVSSDRPRRDDFGSKKLPNKNTDSSFGKKASFGSKPDRFSQNEKAEAKSFEKNELPRLAKKPRSNSSTERPKRSEFGSKNFERRGEGIFERNSSDSTERESFDFDQLKRGSEQKKTRNASREELSKPSGKEAKPEVIYSNEGGKGMIYKGRGRDQKPVFETRTEKPFQEKPDTKQGFGKNRYRNSEENIERPDYNFDALPAKKSKGKEEDGSFRLNKYISNSGICGRREADLLISKGLITVNGMVTTELGLKVKKIDRVVYQGKKINPEKPVYVLLNKPKDFITTTEDPMERRTVMSLVNNACEERIFPVGRLDRNTTGLLLFTNDGELAAKLSHPSNEIKKIYQVTLDNPITQKDEESIREGLTLEDGPAIVDDMQVLSKDRMIIGLEIHIGRNRIVRRLFAHLGYEVTALDRVMYAGLDKKDLKRGHYRFLSEQEVIRLKYFI